MEEPWGAILEDDEDKERKEKPGIELTGYSLVFFQAVEIKLKNIK